MSSKWSRPPPHKRVNGGSSPPAGIKKVREVKMYILVKEAIDVGKALVAVAHASLGMYLKFSDDGSVAEWLSGSFKKVVCKVSQEEFERAKQFSDHVVITESSLGDAEVALAFKPRKEWPKAFYYYRLFR